MDYETLLGRESGRKRADSPKSSIPQRRIGFFMRNKPERACKPDSVLGLRSRSGRGFAGCIRLLISSVTESLGYHHP
jgi:hypothetical protein